MDRKTNWSNMKKLGLDMVTCTSCSQPHQVQRKDLAAHLEAVASKVRGDRGASTTCSLIAAAVALVVTTPSARSACMARPPAPPGAGGS